MQPVYEKFSNLARYSEFLFFIPVLFFLVIISTFNYLLFHSFIELFSVLVAWGIFIIAWNTRDISDNKYLAFVGIAYLFIGTLDLLHTLAYKNMGVFLGYDANLPTQLWIAARYMEAISLIFAIYITKKGIRSLEKMNSLLLVYFILTTVLIFSIFLGFFPTCYIEGEGLTLFKIVSEYFIILILIISGYFLFKIRIMFEKRVFYLLIHAITFTILAEFAFTAYVSVSDFANFLGHIGKLISFYLIFKAIISTSLRNPFDFLFRELKLSQENLQQEKFSLQQSTLQLEKKNLQIEELNKSLGIINSILRHDLMNDLHNIQLSLDVLNIEKSDESVLIARKASQRGMDLIESMNHLEVLTAKQEFQAIHLEELIKSINLQHPSFAIEMDLDKGCVLKADPSFTVVLQNLIRNALEHSGTDRLFIEAKKHSEFCIIRVIDFGCGIPDNLKDKVFLPGFSSKKDSMGLGLYIVKAVMERYGGEVTIEDNNPRGSVFILKIPLWS